MHLGCVARNQLRWLLVKRAKWQDMIYRQKPSKTPNNAVYLYSQLLLEYNVRSYSASA